MKKTLFKKVLSLSVCIVLIAAIALITSGCDNNEGEKTFTLIVVAPDGSESKTKITTDESTVGDALLEEGIVEGADDQYGLYIKSVNGIALDFKTDGMYWAFYIDGEYAMSGVDTTKIDDGAEYMLKAEK